MKPKPLFFSLPCFLAEQGTQQPTRQNPYRTHRQIVRKRENVAFFHGPCAQPSNTRPLGLSHRCGKKKKRSSALAPRSYRVLDYTRVCTEHTELQSAWLHANVYWTHGATECWTARECVLNTRSYRVLDYTRVCTEHTELQSTGLHASVYWTHTQCRKHDDIIIKIKALNCTNSPVGFLWNFCNFRNWPQSSVYISQVTVLYVSKCVMRSWKRRWFLGVTLCRWVSISRHLERLYFPPPSQSSATFRKTWTFTCFPETLIAFNSKTPHAFLTIIFYSELSNKMSAWFKMLSS